MTPIKGRAGKFFITLITVCFAIALAVALFCYILLLRNICLPRYPFLAAPKDYGLAYEEVIFRSSDGLRIAGWFIPKDPSSPTVVTCHGLGTNRSDIIDFSCFLQRAGFNVFSFDFRGHGQSSGSATSFGYLEVRDLTGALNYLDSRHDLKNRNYGVFGISMGASVALMAAAKDERIKAVCADTPYVDLKESILWHVEKFYRYPRFPFGFISLWLYRMHFRCNIDGVSPLGSIARIAPRPVMIINGERDDRMLPEDARRLYGAAKEPKELWLIPGAGHMEGYFLAKGEYERRVTEFFRKWLE